MGPITGIRIVNLRVRNKVAYPDLTLDIAGGDASHLVVGLENGGGKSTLLGAVYHVFVPEAEQFLPRRAQRRQKKEGEFKRLEQYVPGGDPTHFIVELEAPVGSGALPFLTGERLVIGACLWKPAASPPSTPAKEFFWSARCVSDELHLRALNLRGHGGRLLDHREFRAKLKQLRIDLPAAQVNIEDMKGAWQLHLRNLGVDVEYVRQFLLRMNEDEGAADQVFTYASARTFLNSLVGVVGDPTAIEQLKKRLVETAADADGMRLDRQRATLLTDILAHTGPLAESMKELRARVTARDRALEQLLAGGWRLAEHLARAREDARRAGERCGVLETAVAEARSAYGDANARFTHANVQVAEIRARDANQEHVKTVEELDRARTDERTTQAAALLAERRACDARIRDLERLLQAKEIAAEPLRVALSSGVQALERRLKADEERLSAKQKEFVESDRGAADELEQAQEAHTRAVRRLGMLGGERIALEGERASLEGRLRSAVADGLLTALDVDPRTEAARARAQANDQQSRGEEHERTRCSAVEAMDLLTQKASDLAAVARATDHAFKVAEEQFDDAARRTTSLQTTLAASGFVELDPIVLDDHASTVVERLSATIESGRRKQVSMAVDVAAAERAATWLRDHDRLPPRTDIERLGDRAGSARLGARPGWAYLSTLPVDVAAAHATAHPGLADGIVVNVPEDLDAVVSLVTAARDELEGPVTVGLAAAFDDHPISRTIAVVLPHDAHWSTVAGRLLAETRGGESDRLRSEYEDAGRRIDHALELRERVAAWSEEIGLGGLDTRREELARLRREAASLAERRRSVETELEARRTEAATAEAMRDDARKRVHAQTLRAQQLDVLGEVRTRSEELDARLQAIAVEESDETAARDTAQRMTDHAEQRRQQIARDLLQLATTVGKLSSQRSGLRELIAVAVRDGDPVDPHDGAADRDLLGRQVRDRDRRWRGAVTDPELRAELNVLGQKAAEIDEQLRSSLSVVEAARELVARDPSRSANDYREQAERDRARVEQLVDKSGELRTVTQQRRTELDELTKELEGLRRPASLAAEDRTDDLQRAGAIRSRLLRERDAAQRVRSTREAEKTEAEETETLAGEWVILLESTEKGLTGTAKGLCIGGPLVPTFDMAGPEAQLDIAATLTAPGVPESLSRLLEISSRRIDRAEIVLAESRSAINGALGTLDADAVEQRRRLSELEENAGRALDATDMLLRSAPENVVRGDLVLQNLKAALPPQLARLAVDHHDDIRERLIAVRHHVETFDARLNALADTTYATIAEVLREIRRTVRDSQLPDTPAMQRWAGLDLLKLSGLDTLKVEGRRAAIAATLREWFDPDRPGLRPHRLDGDEVVHELLKAVTPHFGARILVPSDPLDPDHKPVDHLALETSGGEGVTVALILASLLASRRASTRGHRRTTLLLDNPFAKVTKPAFLRLARDVADELHVQIVAFTGIRDIGALSVFPRLTQLRVSRRENANFVVPQAIRDDRLQELLRDGTLYVSPTERDAAAQGDDPTTWPVMSTMTIADRQRSQQK